jgi:hypothetical protein
MWIRLLNGCWAVRVVTRINSEKHFRENSLTLHGVDEHSRGASTCSRIAQLSSSGAQHDRVKMNFCAFRILP